MIIMCKAMREIRRDFIKKGIRIGRNEVINEGFIEGLIKGFIEGLWKGIGIGEERMKHAVMQNAMAMGYSEKDIKRILDFGTEKGGKNKRNVINDEANAINFSTVLREYIFSSAIP